MKRQAIRGLVMFGLLTLVVDSARAQNILDSVTVRDRKDGTTKTYTGTLRVGPTGFEIVNAEKKTIANINPDDITKMLIGDLPGVDRTQIQAANSKEEKKEWSAARDIYAEQLKKAVGQERSKRFLEFKKVLMTNRIVDETDADKGWKEKADECIKDWNSFLLAPDTKLGWEQWPAVRAMTRLQIERGKYEDAATAWGRVSGNTNMPPAARTEASLQEIDSLVRGKSYSAAATTAAEQIKTAAGAKKDRLVIYEIAARAGADGKMQDGIDKIKAEMNKTKDASVHAAGFSMMGELYFANGKPRDAMWMFLWVETVVNQDKDDAFKAISRLAEVFEAQMDEEQATKYRDKLKRFRTNF
jgi:hypothetical protein